MALDGRDEMRPEDARIAALYREAAGETPPERLDAAIRKHARAPNDAVKVQKQSFSWPAWRLPLVAATLAVVCASVVTLVMERGGEGLTIPKQTPTPAAEQSPPVSVQSEAPPLSQSLHDRGTVEPQPADPAIPERAERRREAELPKNLPERKAAPTVQRDGAPAGHVVPGAAQSQAADSATSSANTTRRGEAPLTDSQLSAPAAPTAADPVSPRPPAEGDSLREPGPATSPQASPAPKARAAPEAEPRVAPQAKPAPAPAAKPVPPPEAKALSRERIQPTPAQPRMSARASALIAELENEPPARWVERMLALRREDRRQDADALVAEFKRRFPTERLPSDLQQNDE
jgi:hypothetical protein